MDSFSNLLLFQSEFDVHSSGSRVLTPPSIAHQMNSRFGFIYTVSSQLFLVWLDGQHCFICGFFTVSRSGEVKLLRISTMYNESIFENYSCATNYVAFWSRFIEISAKQRVHAYLLEVVCYACSYFISFDGFVVLGICATQTGLYFFVNHTYLIISLQLFVP